MSGNIAARTYDLLRQRARMTGKDVQALVTTYAIERFMARLMNEDDAGIISVKGGQSLGILFGNHMRPTKDLDIDIKTDGLDDPVAWAKEIIMRACKRSDDDGVTINHEKIDFELREHQGDGGLRVNIPASIHTSRASFVIDVGLGNEVTFKPNIIQIPGVLHGHKAAPPASMARIYPHENTIAEKLVSKIEDGSASIRHKDFFDIWLCIETLKRAGDFRLLTLRNNDLNPHEQEFAQRIRAALREGSLLDLEEVTPTEACLDRLGLALARTSMHRGTELPDNLSGFLMEEFGEDSHHSTQWANWCRNQKGRLLYSPPGALGKNRADALKILISEMSPFLDDISQRAMEHTCRAGTKP